MGQSTVVDVVQNCYGSTILVVSQCFEVFDQSKCPGDVVGSLGMQQLVGFLGAKRFVPASIYVLLMSDRSQRMLSYFSPDFVLGMRVPFSSMFC